MGGFSVFSGFSQNTGFSRGLGLSQDGGFSLEASDVEPPLENALYAKAAGGNWSAASTWSATGADGVDNAGPPTSSNNCFITSGSGNVTIDAAASCRSLDCDGYTGTLTHNSAITLSIGDATRAYFARALRLSSGMTYTLGNTDTSAISFVSTNSTQQTIDFSDKTHGSITINGVACSYILAGASTQARTGTPSVTLTNGTFNTNSKNCLWGAFASANSNTRTLTLGASQIEVWRASSTSWNIGTVTNITLNAGTAVITCTGATANFTGGLNLAYYDVRMTGGGTSTLGGNPSINNFTFTGTAAKTDILSLSGSPLFSETLTISGNSTTNRLLVASSTIGTARILRNTDATVNVSNSDFRDITFEEAVNLASITGGSGDCGGNSGITFTTPAAQNCTTGANANWSSSGIWTSRVPLPQDDVTVTGLSAGTLALDMPRLGKNIDLTGATGASAFNVTVAPSIFGSLTLHASKDLGYSSTVTTTLEGRGSFTLTNNGRTMRTMAVTMPSGTLTVADAITITGFGFTLNSGTINFGSATHTIFFFSSTNSNTRTINLDSCTLLLGNGIGTLNSWNLTTTTGLTLNSGTSTIKLSSTDSGVKTFISGARTYNNLVYTGTGSGVRAITGAATFAAISNDNAGSAFAVRFPASVTTTCTSLALAGTSGNVITIDSSTAASAATLSDASGTNTFDYCSIKDITASGGATWNATNSTNVSGNTGINFI